MGFGPLSGGWLLVPGDELPVTVAFIAGTTIADLQKNAQWAQRIYDNDFQGPAAPDQPEFWTEAFPDHVRIYWRDNSEASVDPITQLADFEGYQIQRSTDLNRWFTIAQYDLINEIPDPEFERENFNLGMPYDTIPAPPSGTGWRWEVDATSGDTLGRLYWYDDYNVLRRQTYYYIVRAFDQGVIGAGVLITPIGRSYIEVTVGYTSDNPPPVSSVDEVFVVPNPYLGGHEKEFDGALNDEGNKIYPRKLWFMNLPVLATTIDIYSLAGDHIIQLEHSAGSELEVWDMRNKYQQEIVSGVYYFVVESAGDIKIDKFVVVK